MVPGSEGRTHSVKSFGWSREYELNDSRSLDEYSMVVWWTDKAGVGEVRRIYMEVSHPPPKKSKPEIIQEAGVSSSECEFHADQHQGQWYKAGISKEGAPLLTHC